MRDGEKQFRELFTISDASGKSGLFTLAIEWTDRVQAAHWANLLVKRINRYLREQPLQETRKSMASLKAALARTSVIEFQQVIANLIKGEIKKSMLTRARMDFAFTIIDPAIVPLEDGFIRPKRRLMVTLGSVLGGLLGILGAFFRQFFRGQKAGIQEGTT